VNDEKREINLEERGRKRLRFERPESYVDARGGRALKFSLNLDWCVKLFLAAISMPRRKKAKTRKQRVARI